MTGGEIDLRNASIQGGELLFKRAQLGGGNMSLAGSFAYKGKLCFDGLRIDGGELDLSELEIWCPDKRLAYDVRVVPRAPTTAGGRALLRPGMGAAVAMLDACALLAASPRPSRPRRSLGSGSLRR